MPETDPINLVMVYSPAGLDVQDFEKIAGHVRAASSHVNVHIRLDAEPDPKDLEDLAAHRTLVFSPMQLAKFHVLRGRVYAGRPMQKSEQLLRLQLAGAPVPMWTSLDRGKRLDPGVWGDHVVVKPEMNSRGRGVTIQKTETLNRQSAKFKPFKREARNFLVQKLIKSKDYSKIRIQVLFGEVLYARRFCFTEEVRFETEADLNNYERLFITENTRAEDYDSEEVFAHSKRCVAAYDDVPMLALDVLLDEDENPFFIEANPGGNTWHFSSAMIGRGLREKGVFLERQFDAFKRAGVVLARKAVADAI